MNCDCGVAKLFGTVDVITGVLTCWKCGKKYLMNEETKKWEKVLE